MPEFDSVIPAGQSGTLTAKVATKQGQQGKMRKSISVLTDASGAQNLRLEIAMNVVTPVQVLPSNRVYLQTVAGGVGEQRVILRRSDGLPLLVEDPVSRVGAWVDFEIETVTSAKKLDNGLEALPGDVVLVAELRSEAEAVNRSGSVQLRTNDPNAPVVEIPVTLRVRPLIEPRPQQVQILLSTIQTEGRSTVVRVTHNGGVAFRITEVSSSQPEAFTAGPATDGERTTHNVWIRFADGLTSAAENLPITGFVDVGLEGAGQESLRIPVVLATRRSLASSQRPVATTSGL